MKRTGNRDRPPEALRAAPRDRAGAPCLRSRGPGDTDALARIYRDAIRTLGPRCYGPQQVTAWAALGGDREAFCLWLDGMSTLVALDPGNGPVGFAGWQAPARIAALFVAPSAMRRGVGRTLVAALLDTHAAARPGAPAPAVTTEASEFSRPLFEGFGFRVQAVEHTEVRGVAFTRYAMCRDPDHPGA